MGQQKRCRFTIDPGTAAHLEAVRARTGLPMAEQVRRSIRFWLESDDEQEKLVRKNRVKKAASKERA